MTDVIVQYPLDPTGTNPVNKVTGDVVSMVRRKVRAVAATYGAFFTDSLMVHDHLTQRLLTKDVDYYAAEEYPLPTARYGKSICAVVVILDETVSDQVALTYQALGGDFSTPATNTVQVVQSLNLDNRKATWSPIIPKPATQQDDTYRGYQNTERFTVEHLVFAIDRLARAMKNGDEVAHDALYQYIEANRGQVTPDLLIQIQAELQRGIGAHVAHPDPHSQYYKRSEPMYVAEVKPPTNVSPVQGADGVSSLTSFTASLYRALYRLPHKASRWQVSRNIHFTSDIALDVVTGPVTTFNQTSSVLVSETLYYWRVQYQNDKDVWSPWSDVTGFVTGVVGVKRPTIMSPKNGITLTNTTPTFVASSFALAGATDTHLSSDWEIWSGPDGTGSKIWGVYGDTVNKTSITVPGGRLPNKQKIYPRVRYNSTQNGSSSWAYSNAYDMNYVVLPTVIGQFFEGGYYAGDVVVDANKYAILVASKVGGEQNFALSREASGTVVGADSMSDSAANTTALVSVSDAASWANALTLSNYSDWMIPSSSALAVIRTSLRADKVGVPALFRNGGEQAFAAQPYWSSTLVDWDRDDSYRDADTPVYGYRTVTEPSYVQQITSNNVQRWTNNPTDFPVAPDFCPYVPPPEAPPPLTNQDNSAFVIPVVNEEPNKHGVTDMGAGWEALGAPARYVTTTYFTCNYGYHWIPHTYEKYDIVGYEPGAYHPVTTRIYSAFQYDFAGTAAPTRPVRNTTALVRAIRLIKY